MAECVFLSFVCGLLYGRDPLLLRILLLAVDRSDHVFLFIHPSVIQVRPLLWLRLPGLLLKLSDIRRRGCR